MVSTLHSVVSRADINWRDMRMDDGVDDEEGVFSRARF